MSCSACGTALSPEARFCPSCGHAAAATEPAPSRTLPPEASLVGREVAGRYRILEKLGEGGMGAVFRAEQLSLKRTIALKLLRPELSANPGLVRRFNTEAELAAKLNHPNTVTLFDFGQDTDGALFIAMELVEGPSLREDIARGGPLRQERALAICEQVCASLADAHAVGIVHRDLKPDNVMLTTRGGQADVVRVLDFGIAKLRDERPDGSSVPMTQQGDLLGTPQYMAPEQIRAEKVDGRADIYALGAMLYEMITGRLPFEGPTVMAILSKHLTVPPVPPIDRRRDLGISPAVDKLVLDCMQKDPAARPATMELLRQRIAELRATPSATRHAAMPLKRYQSRPPGVPQPTPSRGAAPVPRAPTPAPVPTPAAAAGPMPTPAAGPMPTPAAGPMPTPAAGPMPTPAQVPHAGWSANVAPMPTPQQLTAGAAPRAGKGWLWALAIVVLVGGGVAGFVIYDRGRGGDAEPASASEATTAEAAPADEGFRSAISGDFTTRPSRKLYELDDVDDAMDDVGDSLDQLEALRSAGFKAGSGDGTRYENPQFGYQLDLPAGFAAETDGDNPGMASAAGMVGGEIAMVVAVAMPVDPQVLGDEGLRSAAEGIASGFGGTLVRLERRRIQGQQLFAGIYDMQDTMRMEIVLYPGAGHFLAVAFGTPPSAFDGTSSVRAALFENGVRVRR